MTKFTEAIKRLFIGVYVCRKCKTKIRGKSKQFSKKELRCRRCGGKNFRPIKKGK